MKKNTRYLSIFLAIIMVLTMMPFSTIGANAVTNVPTISIEASDDTATVGDVITLTVKTTENSELVIVSGIISFDSDCFEVIPDSKTYPQGGLCEINTKTEGKVKFAYVSVAPLADNETNVFSINFKVLKTNGVIDLDVKEVYVLDGNTEVNVTKQASSSVEPLTITCKHSYALESETNATCTVDGVKKYVCSVCDDEYEEVISAFGHTIVAVDAKAPTCTEKGNEAYEYCSVCDYTTYKEISETGHSIVKVSGKAPTCTETGYEAYEYCTVCDYTTYIELSATGHSYTAVVTAPTCTKQGFTTYTCSCGDSYVADEFSATGHTAGDMVVENKSNSTCGTPGHYDEVVYCTVCGDEMSRATKTTDTLPHAYTSKITTAPTCTETGVKTFTCSVCGDAYTESVNATGHSYNAVITSPTCTGQGYTTYTCVCGEAYIADYVDSIGHTSANPVEENYVAPTCTESGSKDVVVYCSVCDEEISREKVNLAPTDMQTMMVTDIVMQTMISLIQQLNVNVIVINQVSQNSSSILFFSSRDFLVQINIVLVV